MKKFFRLSALVMALIMAATVFTACGDKAAKNDYEKEATATVKDFMDKLISLDFDGAMEYVDEGVDTSKLDLDEVKDLNESLSADALIGGDLAELIGDEFNTFVSDIKSLISSHMNYELGEASVKGDTVTVKVTLTMPNDDYAESIDPAMFSSADTLAEVGFDQDEFLTYLTENYSMDEINNFTPEEITSISAKYMKDKNVFSAMFEKISTAYGDALEAAETESYDCIMTLEPKDGKWMITDIK